MASRVKQLAFQHVLRRLADYRNKHVLYAAFECSLSQGDADLSIGRRREVERQVNAWAQNLLGKAWIVCHEREDEESCLRLHLLADTSTADLAALPPSSEITKIVHAILILDIVSQKQYSGLTRTFLSSLCKLDEPAISSVLENPVLALEEARKEARITMALSKHAEINNPLRFAGASIGALAGGILIGATGGLAAPLVGAGLSTVLGFLGFGGSALGVLATGLAGSSVVCCAGFGTYGAKEASGMLNRHMREVKDLEVVNISVGGQGSLGVLCVGGWVDGPKDVKASWNFLAEIFTDGRHDIFAVQWEIEALGELSEGFRDLFRDRSSRGLA